ISPSFCRRLAMFFGGSPRSNSSTTPRRIRSAMRTSTGMVQQVDMQLLHMSLLYLLQVSRRSISAAAISCGFIFGLGCAVRGDRARDDSGRAGFVKPFPLDGLVGFGLQGVPLFAAISLPAAGLNCRSRT